MTSLYLSRLTLNPLRPDARRDLADCHNMHRRLLSAFPDLPTLEQGQPKARERFGVLYRIEPSEPTGARSMDRSVDRGRGRICVLVQSQHAPDWSLLPAGYLSAAPEVKALDTLYDRLRVGMTLAFRLHANPTRRINGNNTQESERWRGKRVQVRAESNQLDWLRRKGEAGGFTVLAARVRSAGASAGSESAASSVSAEGADSLDVAIGAPSGHVRPEYPARHAGGVVSGRRGGTGALTLGSALFEGKLNITDLTAFRSALEQGIGSGKAYGFGLLSIAPILGSS